MTRIVVADGYAVVRLGIEGLLLATDIRVVGESEDGEETIRLAKELRPDLVILGLNLTGAVNGIEACRRIKTLTEPPRILVHAAYAFSGYVLASLLAEADGYLHKGAGPWELLEALRRTVAGERVWSSDEEGNGGKRFRTSTATRGADLTPKEREVLALMLCRCSNIEIASRLHLSLPTVKTHAKRVLRKMETKNREELLRSHAPEFFTL